MNNDIGYRAGAVGEAAGTGLLAATVGDYGVGVGGSDPDAVTAAASENLRETLEVGFQLLGTETVEEVAGNGAVMLANGVDDLFFAHGEFQVGGADARPVRCGYLGTSTGLASRHDGGLFPDLASDAGSDNYLPIEKSRGFGWLKILSDVICSAGSDNNWLLVGGYGTWVGMVDVEARASSPSGKLVLFHE